VGKKEEHSDRKIKAKSTIYRTSLKWNAGATPCDAYRTHSRRPPSTIPTIGQKRAREVGVALKDLKTKCQHQPSRDEKRRKRKDIPTARIPSMILPEWIAH
jgi:hypothetical protein